MMQYLTNLNMVLVSFCYLGETASRPELANMFLRLTYQFAGEYRDYSYVYRSVLSKAIPKLISSGQVKRVKHGQYTITERGIRRLKNLDRIYGLPESIKPKALENYPVPEDNMDLVVATCKNQNCGKPVKTKWKKPENPGSPRTYRINV